MFPSVDWSTKIAKIFFFACKGFELSQILDSSQFLRSRCQGRKHGVTREDMGLVRTEHQKRNKSKNHAASCVTLENVELHDLHYMRGRGGIVKSQ